MSPGTTIAINGKRAPHTFAATAIGLSFSALSANATDIPPMEFPADYAYGGQGVEVLGSQLHHPDEGEGDVILLLHGNPSWSYIWRNVIPHLSSRVRVIAVDNTGFGRSDKP